MGWENPEIPWRELERRLSGRPPVHAAPTTRCASRCTATAATPPPGRASGTTTAPLGAAARPTSTCRSPSCTRTPRSASSTARPSPEELAEEAARLGLEALTLTDHDGVYGVVRFAEAAEALGLATGFGAELSLDVAAAAHAGRTLRSPPASASPTRPARTCSPWPATRTATPGCRRTISTAHLRGGAKGRPVYDARRARRGAPTGTGWCSPAAARARSGTRSIRRRHRRRPARAGRVGRTASAATTSPSSSPTNSTRSPTSATTRWPTLADEFRLPIVATTAAHYHAPPRRPLATALAAVRARSQPGRDRRLAAGLGRPAPAQRRRDGGAVRPLARRGDERRPAGQGDRVLAAAHRAGPAAVPVPGRAAPR